MDKRGQITMFIILGIVITGATLAYLMFSSTSSEQQQEDVQVTKTLGTLDDKVFKSFLTSCLEKSGKLGLDRLGQQGGYLSLQSLSEFNSIPFGQGLPIKYMVPIYANLASDTCVRDLEGDDDGDGVEGPGETVTFCDTDNTNDGGYVDLDAGVTLHPQRIVPAEDFPIDGIDPATGDPQQPDFYYESTDPSVFSSSHWSGIVIPTIEEMENQFQKYVLQEFEDCIEGGIDNFEEYANIDKPEDVLLYNAYRNAYIADDSIRDFQYPPRTPEGELLLQEVRTILESSVDPENLELTGLGYTSKQVSMETLIADEDVRIRMSYPIRATDATHSVTVSSLNVVFDLQLKRLHHNAQIIAENIIRHNAELGEDNIYVLDTDECRKYITPDPDGYALPNLNQFTVIVPLPLKDFFVDWGFSFSDLDSGDLERNELRVCHSLMPHGFEVNTFFDVNDCVGDGCTNFMTACSTFIEDIDELATLEDERRYGEYQVIKLIDYKPKLEGNSRKPYIYQFAVKNVNLLGRCPPIV